MDTIRSWSGLESFGSRCLALLAFALVVSSVDVALHGRSASRWREYALLFLAAAAGALCGAAVDAVTSAVSPDYFVIAKGIRAGEGFRLRAVALGAQAGTGYGALLGGVLLFSAGRGFSRDPPAVRRIVRACLTIPAWGLAAGAAALIAASISPISLPWFRELVGIPDDAVRRMSAAWLCHLGLYAGALVGLVVAIRGLRRWRATRFASASTRMAGEAGIEPATY